MSYAPITGISFQYDRNLTEWIKFYIPNTTTPIAMATDSTGGTLLDKCQVGVDGFVVTDGDAVFIPHINQAYDAWIFKTEAQADANDTDNGTRVAENVTPSSGGSGSGYIFGSVSDMIAGTTVSGFTVTPSDGLQYSTGGTLWRVTTDIGGISLGGGFYAQNIGDVYCDDFNIVADGSTEDQDEYAYIITSAKAGSRIILPLRTATSIVDCKLTSGKYRPAIKIDKQIELIGNEQFTIKLKDFSTAWDNPSSGYIPMVIGVNASNAKVKNVIVDANSDNHYKVNGGFKVWEFNTETTIPPAGIVVYCDELQTNIENVEVSGCTILEPRAGLQASGGLKTSGSPGITDATFLDKTMSTSVVVKPKFFNNRIERARSNAMIAIAGVYDAEFYDNIIVDNMYHAGRLYYAVIDSTMHSNRAYTSYDRIESTWNNSDNGWWRTSDTGSGEYKIDRAGFSMGSSLSEQGAGGGNVKGCSFYNNECHTAEDIRTTTIVDFTSDLSSHFIATRVNKNNTIINNISINSPYAGLRGVIDDAAPDGNTQSEGMWFNGNCVSGAIRHGISSNGEGLIFNGNNFYNCVSVADGAQIRNNEADSIFIDNVIISGPDTDLTAPVIQSRAATTASFYDKNTISKDLDNRYDDEGSGVVVDGGDAPPRVQTLVSGWVNQDIGGPTENLLSVSYTDGLVLLEGYVNASAATGDTLCAVTSTYRPSNDIYFNAVDTAGGGSVAGRLTVGGSLIIPRAGLTTVFISATYRTENLF